jgi:hypothetical protein
MSRLGDSWIASAFAPQRFGGLEPGEACAASEEGSSQVLLAMTRLYFRIQLSNSERVCVRIVAARIAPELLRRLPPSKARGRREAGCTLHPRSRVPNCAKKAHTSIQVQRRHSGFPCAVGYGLFRALPGERAFLPPSLAETSRKPSASIAAPGPHGFTVRDACVRLSQPSRPPHPTARFVTIASRRSHRVRWVEL